MSALFPPLQSLPVSGNQLVLLLFIGLAVLIALKEIYDRFLKDDSATDEIEVDVAGEPLEDAEDSEEAEEDPLVSETGLQITPDFDDILNDDVTEAIRDGERSVSDLNVGKGGYVQALPPHLDADDYDPEEFLCKVETLHQRQIAPRRITKGDTHYKVGDEYKRVLYAHNVPEVTPLAGLKEIIDDPTLHFDLTVHFHANDTQKTLRSAKNLYQNLEASGALEAESGDRLSADDKTLRRERVGTYRDEIKQNDERPCSMTMYVTVSSDDQEGLLQQVDEIRDEFRTTADIQLKTIERNQKDALVSASPLGYDKVYELDPYLEPDHQWLGGSFGALVASLTQSRKFEPSGHEWGFHSVQGHPIVKDPFKSPRNYNMTVVGESGSGKSLNTKRMALAAKAVREDTLIIMLDPLQGFVGMAEALDATKVTIGGDQNLNPMEIRKPPEAHIESEAFDEEKDPLSAKVDDVMAFVQNYVAQEPGLEFGEESQLLRSLILAAYKRQGINHDVRTHDKESPTLMDVLELAEHAKDQPEKWARGPQDPEDIVSQAEALGNILREFAEGGQHHNLAQQSEEDPFGDSDVIYLDLSQQEASGGSGTGVMGQLMFSLAYEKCKQYPGPAIYIIDEARFLFREADTLDYLVQRNRHSRHYDTSIRFITQEMDDFLEFDSAEGIINNSSFQVIHQAPDVDDWGDRFGLKEPHKDFVKNAATGTDMPYSQALVRFPEEDQWYPLTIELGERMLAIADFDEQEDNIEELPGRGGDIIEQSPMTRELIARVRNKAHSHDEEVAELLEEWEVPIWNQLTDERAQECVAMIVDGHHPREALYTQALEQTQDLVERLGGEEMSQQVLERLKATIRQNYAEDYTDLDPDEAKKILGKRVRGSDINVERNGNADPIDQSTVPTPSESPEPTVAPDNSDDSGESSTEPEPTTAPSQNGSGGAVDEENEGDETAEAATPAASQSPEPAEADQSARESEEVDAEEDVFEELRNKKSSKKRGE